MRRFAADHGIDLEASWAYSDSVSDLPMLELVGHPVVVNPDSPLASRVIAAGRSCASRGSAAASPSAAPSFSPPVLGGAGSWAAARRGATTRR